jgi:hypothetical protein
MGILDRIKEKLSEMRGVSRQAWRETDASPDATTWRDPRHTRPRVTVGFDEREIWVRGIRVNDRVAWDVLAAIHVETNSGGPWIEDVHWILVGADRTGCVVPSGAAGADALLSRLLKLPGFDHAEFAKAMGSTADASFLCWRRDAA